MVCEGELGTAQTIEALRRHQLNQGYRKSLCGVIIWVINGSRPLPFQMISAFEPPQNL